MTNIRASLIARAQILEAGMSMLDIINRHIESRQDTTETMANGTLLHITTDADGFVCLHSELECRQKTTCPTNNCPKF